MEDTSRKAMVRLLRRFSLPVAIVFAIGILVWRYQAALANTLPDTSILENDRVQIEVESFAADGVAMQEHVFRIEVKDTEGIPTEGAEVQMKLFMPSMFCGEIPATVASSGSGQFEAKGVPVMSGRWEAKTVIYIGAERYEVDHAFKVPGR